MKRKIVFLVLSSILLFTSCNGNNLTSNFSSSETNTTSSFSKSTLPLEARVFIDSINSWIEEEITLEHKNLIDSAYFIYDSLSDESKELDKVKEAKARLDKAKEEFLVLYHAYLNQKEAEEAGYAFVDEVNKCKNEQNILKEDEDLINQLNKMYDSLSEEAKEILEVKTAKEKLDRLNESLETIRNMTEEEYICYEFLVNINSLPALEELTINQIDLVYEAQKNYEELDEQQKNNDQVVDAYELLNSLIARCEELKTIRDHAESFMDQVYKLPTFDKLKWRNSDQDNQIKACELSYQNLTEEEKNYPGVSSAYNELLSTRKAFDALKEPIDITKFGFYINLGGYNTSTNNYDLKVSFTNGKDPISVLTGYYKFSKDNLSDYATVYLNIYREAGAVKENPLYKFDITENYNLSINDFVKTLQELKNQGNEKAVSGEGYNFTMNIESKSDQYASSEYTGFTGGARINF